MSTNFFFCQICVTEKCPLYHLGSFPTLDYTLLFTPALGFDPFYISPLTLTPNVAVMNPEVAVKNPSCGVNSDPTPRSAPLHRLPTICTAIYQPKLAFSVAELTHPLLSEVSHYTRTSDKPGQISADTDC
jgi:hypothetical protein